MKTPIGINTLHVIKYPSGKFGYAGKVPIEIGYIDPTPEKIKAMQHCGARFGPKVQTFDTRKEAIDCANEHGFTIEKEK